MKKHYLLLIIIILLGAFLRLYRLGEIPSGYFRDEAAISYNAYSIWESGKDEFGVRLPLVFRSFEVFFLPLYIYLSAPIVGLMGLSEFSSRLLSAISGIVALLFIYLIGKRIVNKKTGLLALLILAISPWHIYYSRGTFEGNLALTLFSGGFYFWLRFVEHFKKKYVLISGLLFAFSMYSYQAERLVVPLFSLIAIYLSFNKMWERRKALVVPALLIIAVLVPLLSLTFSAGGYHRASGVSILSSTSKPPGWIEGEPAGLFSNNKIYLRGRQLTALYLSYFSPKNIFIEADFDMQRSVEDFSVFYVWTLPFMLLGFYKLFSNFSKENKLLAVWIFLAPLPAAATADPFHTYRSLLLYFPLSLLAGKGLEVTYEYISAKKIAKLKHFGKYLFLLLLTFISIISLSAFLFQVAHLLIIARGPGVERDVERLPDRAPIIGKVHMGPLQEVLLFVQCLG